MAGRSFEMRSDDPNLPRIAHRLEVGVDPERGELLFHYNFLTYEFDHPRGVVGCRAYLHDVGVVSVFGLAEDVDVEIEYAEIPQWLRARFALVRRLGGQGYVDV